MGAQLWGPIPGGFASVWFPGGMASCDLPDRGLIDFSNPPTYAPWLADTFTDVDGTTLYDHYPEAYNGGWIIVSGPDFIIKDNSLSVGSADSAGTTMFMGAIETQGKLFYDFQCHFADYGKNELGGFITFDVQDENSTTLGTVNFVVSRASETSALTVTPTYSMVSYGSADLDPIELSTCNWHLFGAKFDWTNPPEPVLIITVDDNVVTIPLLGEGWNNSSLYQYQTTVQAYNLEANSFRITDLAVYHDRGE